MLTDRDVTLWPSASNYDAFRALCDDTVPATFDAFVQQAFPRLAALQDQYGITVEKLAFDPQAMAIWCREHYGRCDAESRRAYAGHLALTN